jgi:single-stranded-DNA-specific exonuclease
MRATWSFNPLDLNFVNEIAGEFKLSVLTCAILAQRGFRSLGAIARFINPSLSDLHDPFLLKDMDKAVARIKKAVAKKEKVLLYGDYDVDGITATAIAYALLNGLGLKPLWKLPTRKDGYGLNKEFLRYARTAKPDLVIALDCGSTEREAIDSLVSHGSEVIVIDHHQIDRARVPKSACALVNPRQDGCEYPFKELTACGLAFKLAHAFGGNERVDAFLELAALGTICDVALLTGENRILAKFGMEALAKTKNQGLRALMDIASIRATRLRAEHISFMLGPRINATGRIASPEQSLELLLERDAHKAKKLAQSVDAHNRDRRTMQEAIFKEALRKIEHTVNFAHDKAIVLHDARWHTGVLGIVASKIADRFYRPCLLIGKDENCLKGSGRSIKEFNLFQALEECRGLLKNYGGHEAAVGFSIEERRVAEFKEAFAKVARIRLEAQKLIPTLAIDAWIGLGDLGEDFFKELAMLEPFGVGNEQPMFATENLKMLKPATAKRSFSRASFRFWITDASHVAELVVPWDYKDTVSYIEKGGFDIAYRASLEAWAGKPSLKLSLEDIRVS